MDFELAIKTHQSQENEHSSSSNSLEKPRVPSTELDVIDLQMSPIILTAHVSVEVKSIVFFDLETTGFGKSAGILQIAAKINNKEFSTYINPTQNIPVEATQVHGLENRRGELFRNGNKLNSLPLIEALHKFYLFLQSSRKPAMLVAHNAIFDSTILFQAIKRTEWTSFLQKLLLRSLTRLLIFEHDSPVAKARKDSNLQL